MAIPSSGEIGLDDIRLEFGGVAPHGLSEYYGVSAGVPSSGVLSISDFYGASAITRLEFLPDVVDQDSSDGSSPWTTDIADLSFSSGFAIESVGLSNEDKYILYAGVTNSGHTIPTGTTGIKIGWRMVGTSYNNLNASNNPRTSQTWMRYTSNFNIENSIVHTTEDFGQSSYDITHLELANDFTDMTDSQFITEWNDTSSTIRIGPQIFLPGTSGSASFRIDNLYFVIEY